jgi:signal transduction histidine kinase
MKKRDWYRLALIGAVLVVLLNTWIAARSLHKVIDSQDGLTQTQDVVITTEQLAARVRGSESAARGFILAGSANFQQQYIRLGILVDQSLDRLQKLTAADPIQQTEIVELRSRISAKMAVLDAGMAERRGHPDGAIDPSLLTAVINDTPDRLESVQQSITRIQNEEERLLGVRAEAQDRAREQVWASFIIAFLLDFVLLLAAFEFLVRLSREREALAQNAAEIVSLNSQLKSANSELEERVARRTRELAFSNQELEAFSYSVSHDLRAPLRTIDGFSLALQEDFSDNLNDTGRDYIARVRAGVQRMGTLIDALLQLSRVTRSEVQTDTVDLSQLATLVFNELAASDPARNVEFIAQPGVSAQGDPRLLRIALENLIGNAWKFTSKVPQPRIEFGSRASDGGTVYFIKDNGAGFDMQYVDRLFTAFQRLHGDRDFKGSGIGLATVSRILRRHHGSIRAESAPGVGATFSFTLASASAPVAPAPVPENA